MYDVRVRRRVFFGRKCLVNRVLRILFWGLGYRG